MGDGILFFNQIHTSTAANERCLKRKDHQDVGWREAFWIDLQIEQLLRKDARPVLTTKALSIHETVFGFLRFLGSI